MTIWSPSPMLPTSDDDGDKGVVQKSSSSSIHTQMPVVAMVGHYLGTRMLTVLDGKNQDENCLISQNSM